MNELLEKALLFDFYGELLTQHQKSIYEKYISEDLSISEIAKETGISRQGVHDLIKRSTGLLKDYEKTLRLVERFLNIRKKVEEIGRLVEGIQEPSDVLKNIHTLSKEIIEEL